MVDIDYCPDGLIRMPAGVVSCAILLDGDAPQRKMKNSRARERESTKESLSKKFISFSVTLRNEAHAATRYLTVLSFVSNQTKQK